MLDADEDDFGEGYFDPCLGTVILAVHDGRDDVWIHLSDGSALEFFPVVEGGFNVELHPPVECTS
jgi:hypothetical protein